MGVKTKLGNAVAVDMNQIKLPSRRLGSMYDPLVEIIKKKIRKVGQGYKIAIPRGVSGRVFLNRLHSSLKRLGLPEAPKGARWRKSVLDGGKEAVIGLVAVRRQGSSEGRPTKAKGKNTSGKKAKAKRRKTKPRKPEATKPVLSSVKSAD